MRKLSAIAAALGALLSSAQPLHAEQMVLPTGTPIPAGFRAIADYGSYRLFDGDAAAVPDKAWLLADTHLLRFDRLQMDTRLDSILPPSGFALQAPSGAGLQIIQFVGPIKDAWLEQVRVSGALPIQYIDSFGYLVWADSTARAKLDAMAGEARVLQFSQPLPGFIKLGHSLFDRLQRGAGGGNKVSILVQRFRHDGDAGRERFAEIGLKPLDDWTPQLAFEIARFEVSDGQIRQLIDLPDVFWLGEYIAPTMNDEVQAQILRGGFNADQSGPLQPGYLPWLQSLGFPDDPAAYPILDITDSGIGDRTIQTGDPTLHRFGSNANATRMAYNQKCTINNGDVDGHGHINANIALGYDVRENASTPGARFPGEFQRGQGMNPFGRLGGTRVFAPAFDLAACGGTYAGVIAASYTAGARISSNSWGCAACAGQYDVSSQAYDAGTRDADPDITGNQELITIFSAGNSGPYARSIGSPGNGKNMITVGASENARPVDEDGAWNDGCQIDGGGADDAMDVIFFSSRGPAEGGRVKPELVAPGTHVSGTRARPGIGEGICDATRPVDNVTYAASSGTSHAAPAIAGVASLAWWWMANAQGSLEFAAAAPSAPSPALMKSWLVAHPTYLTGANANDTLPSNAQGFGMPNLADMFSDVPTYMVNQEHVFTDSGQLWTMPLHVVDPSRPVRIVLAWTDAPGLVGTSPQVNNLDLELLAGSSFYRGNRFAGAWSIPAGSPDAANNVEAIFLPAGATGPLSLSVRAFNIAGDGLPGNADISDQDFALVCSNCAKNPSFTFSVGPSARSLCTATAASATWSITTGSVLGFTSPVGLSLSGQPAAASVVFSANPVSVPGSANLTLGNLSGLAGNYTLSLHGQAAGISRTRNARLQLASANPSTPVLVAPVNNDNNAALQPMLNWQAVGQAREYRVEIARDAAFGDVVYSTITAASTHVLASELDHATLHYWRVTAINACGESAASAVFTFTTTPLPGECPLGTTPTILHESNFEDGLAGWTHSGDHDTWALSAVRAHGVGQSMLAQDVPYDSDQRLVSPAIQLPTGSQPLSLGFWSQQTIENRIGGCYDGALLEISSDAGASWRQVPPSRVLVGPYQGPISRAFGNPTRGQLAWCGDPGDWSRTLIDLQNHAGATVQLRFRLATDASTGRVPHGFYLDDVTIQYCAAPADMIFRDGFEIVPPKLTVQGGIANTAGRN